MSYVERNPVRAKMVRLPWRYKWSSAGAHVGQKDTADLLDLDTWRNDWSVAKWKKQLQRPEDDKLILQLRRGSQTGRPLAADSFLSKLERKLGRRIRPNPIGRPKTQKKTTKKRKRTKNK